MSSLYRRLYGLFRTNTPIMTAKLKFEPKPAPELELKTKVVIKAKPKPEIKPISPMEAKKLHLQKMVVKYKKLSESPDFGRRRSRYNNIVHRFASANMPSLIHEFLDHQKKFDWITIEGFTIRLILLYGKSGMFEHARQLFDEMPQLNCPRTVRSFNALMSAYVGSKEFDKVKEIFRDLPPELGIEINTVSYNILMRVFFEIGAFDSALSLVDEMENNDLSPDVVTYNTLLSGFYGNGRFADGDNVWKVMESKEIVPNARSYNAKIRGLVDENKIEEAIKLLDEMRIRGVQPISETFNALLKKLCLDQKLEKVKSLYHKLCESDCKPDTVTYTTLVPFLNENGEFDLALEICKEIINKGVRLRSVFFQSVVDVLVKESRIDDAKQLVLLAKNNIGTRYKLNLPNVEVSHLADGQIQYLIVRPQEKESH